MKRRTEPEPRRESKPPPLVTVYAGKTVVMRLRNYGSGAEPVYGAFTLNGLEKFMAACRLHGIDGIRILPDGGGLSCGYDKEIES